MNYQNRIAKLKELLKTENLDAILVSNVSNIFYFTGFSNFSKEEREAYLIVTRKEQYIMTDSRYSEAVEREVPHCEILVKSPSAAGKTLFKNLIKKENIKTLGIETDNITVAEYTELKKVFSSLHPIEVSRVREIKEDSEIELIQQACKIGDDTFEYILNKIKPGITERELAWEMEKYIREHSAILSFDTIVAFGSHSSVPHHQTNNESRLVNNSIVLLDFGVKYQNYCSDMTRTVFVGKATNEQKKMYEAVRIAQEKAIELLSSVIPAQAGIQKNEPADAPNSLNSHQARTTKNNLTVKQLKTKDASLNADSITAHDIDAAARKYILKQGYPSIPHSVGHGIGLEVHELPHVSPDFKTKIKPGMVFSVEPGIYIPGFGGVRIEDLVAIRKDGVDLLTHAPKNIIEL